ncbi:MAG: glycosyltransferase [Candidatus Omnitrophota bacterium]
MSLVSVIIPTYNNASFISEAVDSVLAQTYTDYEIVVIDDGSTDNTKEILSKYNNKIRYFYQENKGVSSARNLGIRQATGEYIAFLDADDLMLPDRLDELVRFSEQNSLIITFSDFYEVHSEQELHNLDMLSPRLKISNYTSFFPLENNSICNCANKYVIKQKSFLKIALKILGCTTYTIFLNRQFLLNELNELFDCSLKYYEDNDMWWRCILHPKIKNVGYINKPLSIYRFYLAGWNKESIKVIETYQLKCLNKLTENLFTNYRYILGKRYLAEKFWEKTWQLEDPRNRLSFYKEIIQLNPLELKYWKSFVGLILKIGVRYAKRKRYN